MQLRKQNWKKLRAVKPCCKCGKDHESKFCIRRDGRKSNHERDY